jgi:hypothetical protein
MTKRDPAAEFRAAQPKGGLKCTVTAARETMSPAQRIAFDSAMIDRSISVPTICRVLLGWGIRLGHHPIGDHRRGDCACPR